MGINTVINRSVNKGDGIMKLKYLLLIFLLIGQASALTITPAGDTHVVIEPGTTYNFSYTVDGPTTTNEFYSDWFDINGMTEEYYSLSNDNKES